MGRKRSTRKDDRLPPYVYRKPRLNAVEYRPYLGKGRFGASVYLKDKNGKQLKAVATLDEIVKAYHRTIKDENDHGRSLSWLFPSHDPVGPAVLVLHFLDLFGIPLIVFFRADG